MNTPGTYPTCCVQLCLDGLAVNTVLQSTHINDYEGVTGGAISFDCAPQVTIGIIRTSLYMVLLRVVCVHIFYWCVCMCIFRYMYMCYRGRLLGCTCACTHVQYIYMYTWRYMCTCNTALYAFGVCSLEGMICFFCCGAWFLF